MGDKITVNDFFKITKDAAILGISVVLAVYAKITGDLKPLLIFGTVISLAFIIYLINRIMGQLNFDPK